MTGIAIDDVVVKANATTAPALELPAQFAEGGTQNITVRLPSGGGFSGGPYHSQNPEAWFMHAPGLKIVAPSTASHGAISNSW